MKKIFSLLAMIIMLTTSIHAQIPTNGLVAWYPFTGNTLDSSGNNNHGTNNGATLTTDRFGKANSAYSFNGTTNNIYIPHPILSQYPCDSNWTISFWFLMPKPLDSMSNFYIFNNGSGIYGQINPFGYAHNPSNPNHIEGYWWKKKGVYTIDSVFSKNIWYHFTYVYKSSGNNLKVFLNGKDNSGATLDLTSEGGSAINLGKWYVGSSGYSESYFNGKVDDIVMYNRALDSTEVKALYNEGGYGITKATIIASFSPTTASTGTTVTFKGTSFTNATAVSFGGTPATSFTVINDSTIKAVVGNGTSGIVQVITPNGTASLSGFTYSSFPTNGLVAHYPFTGNTLDSSGNGNHGTNNGATLTVDRFGKVNRAYSFDGNTSNILVGNFSNWDMYKSDFTMSVWFQTNDTIHTREQMLIGKDSACSGPGQFRFEINEGGGVSPKNNISVVATGLTGASQFRYYPLPDNKVWIHATVVKTNQVSYIYYNGNLVSTYINDTNVAVGAKNFNCYIGARLATPACATKGNLTNFFWGDLDDIRIYNRALDNTEVQALYNEGGWNTLLPVQLQQLTATAQANSISLQWQTVKATNTDYFVVERSTNGLSFVSVGKVDAFSSTPNYVYTDAQATLGTNYYRLKIVDKDGSSSYSKIVSAALGSQQTLSVYPNPAKDKVFIQFTPAVGKGSVVIRSVAGKILHNTQIDLQQGKAIIPIYNLSKGVYAIQLMANHQLQVHTLVVE